MKASARYLTLAFQSETTMHEHIATIRACLLKALYFGKHIHASLAYPPRMAPEVVIDHGYSAKVDIWSLSCLLIEMLTGTRPWKELNELAARLEIYIGICSANPLWYFPRGGILLGASAHH
ncbi:mitogen-activated protein kinase kinase kinase, partial [Entomophthora muscae]